MRSLITVPLTIMVILSGTAAAAVLKVPGQYPDISAAVAAAVLWSKDEAVGELDSMESMEALLLAALAVACLAMGGFLGMKVLAKSDPAPVLHTMIPPPRDTDYDLSGTAPGPVAISPDGAAVAVVSGNGLYDLYLLDLATGEEVAWESPLPADFAGLVAALETDRGAGETVHD